MGRLGKASERGSLDRRAPVAMGRRRATGSTAGQVAQPMIVSRNRSVKTRMPSPWRYTVPWLVLATACTTATPRDLTQRSEARGARDPIPASVIVGAEGKGMFTGAGIPPDNTPIYAARDGATPPGVAPLPI